MAIMKVKDGGVAKELSIVSNVDVNELKALVAELASHIIGKIDWFGTREVPDKWLLCDGRELAIVDYEDLYNAIGTQFGSASSIYNFKLPNLIDRVAWGGATAGTYKAAGIPDIIGEFNAGPAGNSGWNQVVGNAFAFNQGIGGSYRGTAVRQNFANASSGNTNVSNSNWTRFRASSGEVPSTTSITPANNVYGKSATVQPPALTLLPCIRAVI